MLSTDGNLASTGSPANARAPGIDIDALVDDRVEKEGIFRVSKSIYVDPQIFELELEKIFARSWNYLCHESQLRNVGDYAALEIARKPVFAIRATDGSVRAYFDACSHRGARLTTRRYGRASTITCRYHGWCFDTAGRCLKVQYLSLIHI